MTAAALLDELRAEGVAVRARGDRIGYDAPAGVMNPDRLAELASHKLELLAILTRCPVRSRLPGIIWDPRGGVRVEHPPDLRRAAYDLARWRAFPSLALPEANEVVASGAEAWRRFAEGATISSIGEALLLLDDVPTRAGG